MIRRFLVLMAALLLAADSFVAPALAADPTTLTKANTLVLRGEVNAQSVGDLIKQIETHPGQELTLYIVSPGGDIIEGMHLIDAMKAHKGKITCVADVAISMAFIILENCETRLALPTGVLMQHEASYAIRGDAPHNLSFITWLHSILHKLDDTQAKRIGLSYEEFKKHTAVDWWQDGQQALANHVVDDLIQVNCSKELTETKVTQEIELMFGAKAVVTWNGCPLVHAPENVQLKMPAGFKGEHEAQVMEAYQKVVEQISDFSNRENIDQLNGNYERLR